MSRLDKKDLTKYATRRNGADMILEDNQYVNVVVRGLIFNEGHILVTEWKTSGNSFGIGGRVDFGEAVVDSLQREMREEIGVEVTVRKLLYFSENLFRAANGRMAHELGWYFWVEPEGEICALGEILPNPDHPDLIIRWLKMDQEQLDNFWPRTIRHYLLTDFVDNFRNNPRNIHSRALDEEDLTIREIEGMFSASVRRDLD